MKEDWDSGAAAHTSAGMEHLKRAPRMRKSDSERRTVVGCAPGTHLKLIEFCGIFEIVFASERAARVASR